MFRVDTPDAPLLVDGLPTYIDGGVEVALDFWSPGGHPFVALRNLGDTTLLLDLQASGVLTHPSRSRQEFVDFATWLGAAGSEGTLRRNFPDLDLRRREGELLLAVAPGDWEGLEAAPMAASRNPYRPRGRAGRYAARHTLTLVLVYRREFDHAVERLEQRAAGELVDRVFRKDLEAFEREHPDIGRYYFHDRHTDRDAFLMTVLDVAVSVSL